MTNHDTPADSQPKQKKPFYKRWWFIALAVVVVFGGIATALETPEDRQARADERAANEEQKAEEREQRAADREADRERRDEERAAEEAAAEEERVAAETPQEYDGPYTIPNLLSVVENLDDVRIEARDIGHFLVDDVDRERGIFDKPNWRVVAQCTTWENGRLNVGVVQESEFQAMTAAGFGDSIAENTYSFTLECP